MKLAEMRQMLSEQGVQLTKSLGQNFLHEEKVIAKIAAAGELTKADKVLEIGPGVGPLTELLLAQAGEVLAIEMDARLVEILRGRFQHPSQTRSQPTPHPCKEGSRNPDAPANAVPLPGGDRGALPQTAGSLQLLHADALKYLEANLRDWRGWKLVSNLPYSVASPILVELALAEHGPERMVATLQLEVAKRLKAQANDEDYGLLTLLVQLNYEPRALFRISAGCFFPQPNVDSACLTLVRRPQPLLTPAQTKVFVRIVKQAFSQRRKMMAKLLRADWPEEQLARAMSELGLSPQIRAEAVTLKQFVELVRLMTEDIFDIVNERDEVIGRAPRREVHARGLLHRAVHVLVFNARGELFLQKRSKTKDREPGRWGAACSGHVDSGEDYDTAAVRELGEELGWRPGMPLERILRIEACRETDQEFVWVYRCSGEGPFALNAEEVETGGWFSPQQLEQWLAERPEEFTTAFVLLWRLLRGKN